MTYSENDDLTKKNVRITELIDRLLWSFPTASPKDIAKMLTQQFYSASLWQRHYKRIYEQYKNMISVRKSLKKKWDQTKVEGRLPKPLVSAHRVEWEIEGGLAMPFLLVVREAAGACRPRLEDPRPVGTWYVIPNRNRQLEFHNEHVTVRVFPKSGTCRILTSHDMDWKEFTDNVWDAFLGAGLTSKDCDEIVLRLGVTSRHRTFKLPGPVTPFHIDFYKDSLGIPIIADGTHPEHIEVPETWPVWIKPLLLSIARQTASTERQTEAVTLLAEQIRLHLSVMKGIDSSAKDSAAASRDLKKATEKLLKVLGVKIREKKKRVKVLEFGQHTLSEWK